MHNMLCMSWYAKNMHKHEYAEICKKYAYLCRNMQKICISMNMQKYEKICRNMQKYANICICHEFTSLAYICQNMQKIGKICKHENYMHNMHLPLCWCRWSGVTVVPQRNVRNPCCTKRLLSLLVIRAMYRHRTV